MGISLPRVERRYFYHEGEGLLGMLQTSHPDLPTGTRTDQGAASAADCAVTSLHEPSEHAASENASSSGTGAATALLQAVLGVKRAQPHLNLTWRQVRDALLSQDCPAYRVCLLSVVSEVRDCNCV